MFIPGQVTAFLDECGILTTTVPVGRRRALELLRAPPTNDWQRIDYGDDWVYYAGTDDVCVINDLDGPFIIIDRDCYGRQPTEADEQAIVAVIRQFTGE